MGKQEHPDDQLASKQAAEYLSKKWGIPYSVDAFRQHRYRLKKRGEYVPKPVAPQPNSSLWRRRDLDLMPRPESAKQRFDDEESDGSLDIDKHLVVSCGYA